MTTTWGNTLRMIIYFALLFFLVLLGDGKQSLALVCACAGVVSLYIFDQYVGFTTYPCDKKIILSWGLFFIALCVSSVGAVSVGYAVSDVVRYALAVLVFLYFTHHNSPREIYAFGKTLFMWCNLVIFVSFILLIFPSIQKFIPSMNLLYKAFGHNHVVDVVIFLLPLLVERFIHKRDIFIWMSFTVVSVVALYSFARGFLVVFGIYSVYYAFFRLQHHSLLKRVGFVLAICGILAGVFFLFSFTNTYASISPFHFDVMTKKEPIIQSRVYYWRQAEAAFVKRPLFGWGPGSFSLVSKRFQDAPGLYSWYAHSFPLQLLAELGVFGFAAMSLLLFYSFSSVINSLSIHDAQTSYRRALFESLALLFLYSCIEFSLDFIVIWLLFWATSGVLYQKRQHETPHHPSVSRLFIGALMTIVSMYYLSSASSALVSFVPKGTRLAFLFQPYNTDQSINYIRNNAVKVLPVWPDQQLIRLFHSDNADVLMQLAQKTGSPTLSKAYFAKAIDADGENVLYISQYIQYLLQQHDEYSIGNFIQKESEYFVPTESIKSLKSIQFTMRQIIDLYTPQLFMDAKGPLVKREYFAKLYYFLGLSILYKDPEQTRALWTLARDLLPRWGNFHVELAGLYKYYLGDENMAKNILQACEIYDSPRAQCRDALDNGIPPVGDQAADIRLIPQK